MVAVRNRVFLGRVDYAFVTHTKLSFSLPPALKAMCSSDPRYIAPTVTSCWPLPFFSMESRRAVSAQAGIVLSALETSLPMKNAPKVGKWHLCGFLW